MHTDGGAECQKKHSAKEEMRDRVRKIEREWRVIFYKMLLVKVYFPAYRTEEFVLVFSVV